MALRPETPGPTVGAPRTAERAKAPGPTVGAPRTAGARRIPLTGARGAAAELFTRSRREIPEATVWVDVDATSLLDARTRLNAARPDEPVSLLALLARFSVLGLQRFPSSTHASRATRSPSSMPSTWASPPRPTTVSSYRSSATRTH